jgi:ABC-2 type transport system ATP-binding protein
MEEVIRIEDLTKIYHLGRNKTVTGLDSLNLRVYKGEIFGIIGPNGSGKTTALKLLLGLLFPTKGSVSIFGKNIENIEVKKDIGYLPESPYYYQYLTPVELLDFYAEIFEIKDKKERIEELLGIIGLKEARRLRLANFSKGMLERIGLGVALLNDPSLLILDEPTTGLDPIGSRETRNLFLRLKEEGKTILLSSHYLSEIEKVSDRIGVLYKGRLLALGTLGELFEQNQVKDVESLFVKVIEETTKTNVPNVSE